MGHSTRFPYPETETVGQDGVRITMTGPPMKTCPACLGSGLDHDNKSCQNCGGIGDIPK